MTSDCVDFDRIIATANSNSFSKKRSKVNNINIHALEAALNLNVLVTMQRRHPCNKDLINYNRIFVSDIQINGDVELSIETQLYFFKFILIIDKEKFIKIDYFQQIN